MASAALFRAFALSLPGTFESAHSDHPDFRIQSPDRKGRIFATLSGEAAGLGVLKLTPEQQASFMEEMPDVFEPCKGGWGRMGMTYVHLEAVGQDMLLGALTTAHRNVAAKLEPVKFKRIGAPNTVGRKPPGKRISTKPRIKE